MNVTSLRPLSKTDLDALSQQLKHALSSIYGHQLDQLILFGSYARGDFRNDSDVDYLVVLKQDTIHFGQEVDKISTIASQLGLDYTVHVSVKPVSASAYNQSTRLFYQAVHNEGIVV